jgi:hypothetical protein
VERELTDIRAAAEGPGFTSDTGLNNPDSIAAGSTSALATSSVLDRGDTSLR